MAVSLFSGASLRVCAVSAALLVAYVASMYVLNPYFLEGIAAYEAAFMDLEEVQALHREYPAAEPVPSADSGVAYSAIPYDWRAEIVLVVHHKPHSLEVTGMRLTCLGDDGAPAWSVEDDILHHIISRRCF